MSVYSYQDGPNEYSSNNPCLIKSKMVILVFVLRYLERFSEIRTLASGFLIFLLLSVEDLF